MEIKVIDKKFSICKIKDTSLVNFEDEYYFLSKTDEELSLVCETKSTPSNIIEKEDGWKAFRIQGILDFSLIGILSKISALLAENQISIFVVSTFNTDYILVKEKDIDATLDLLKTNNYSILR